MNQMNRHAPVIPPRNRKRPVYIGNSPDQSASVPYQSPAQAGTSPTRAPSTSQPALPPEISNATSNVAHPQPNDMPQSASLLQGTSKVFPPLDSPLTSPNISGTTRDENALPRMSVRSLRLSEDRGSLSDSSQLSLQQGAPTLQRLGGSFEWRNRVPEGAYTIHAPAPPSVVRSVPRQSSRSRSALSTTEQDGSSFVTKSTSTSVIVDDPTDARDTNTFSTQSSLPPSFHDQVQSPIRGYDSSETPAPVSLTSSPTDISAPSQPPLPPRPLPPKPVPLSTENEHMVSSPSITDTRADPTNRKKEKRLFFLNLPKRNSESKIRDLFGSKKESHGTPSATSTMMETPPMKNCMPPSPKPAPVSAPLGPVSEDETLIASRRLAFTPAQANSPWAPSEATYTKHEPHTSPLEVVQVTPPKMKEARHAFDVQSPPKLPTEAWSFAPSESAVQASRNAELDEQRMPWAVSESPWPVHNSVPFELEDVETVQPVTSLPILSQADSTAKAEVPTDFPAVLPHDTNGIPSEMTQEPGVIPTETVDKANETPSEMTQEPGVIPTETVDKANEAPNEMVQEPGVIPTETVDKANEAPSEMTQERDVIPTETVGEEANKIPSEMAQEPSDIPAPTAGEVDTSKDASKEATQNTGTGTDANAHEPTILERIMDFAMPGSSAASTTDTSAAEQASKVQIKEHSTLEHLAENILPGSMAGIAAGIVGRHASEQVNMSALSDTVKETEKQVPSDVVPEATAMANTQDATVTSQSSAVQADRTSESLPGTLPTDCVSCDSTTEAPIQPGLNIEPPIAPEHAIAMPKPCLVIEYCDRCRWMHRAIWLQTELLITFSEKGALDNDASKASGGGYLASSMLVPQAKPETAGRFRVWLVLTNAVELIWDRKTHGGFPELRVLKNRVRDKVAPTQHLGHSELVSHE